MKRSEARTYVVGIDEAGRGPLAGPVSVCALGVRDMSVLNLFKGVKDSKQLTEKQREEYFARIKAESKKGTLFYKVGMASAKSIDRNGIAPSIRSIVNRCLQRLENIDSAFIHAKIKLDGSLHASSRYTDQEMIIRGDENVPIIALASICAKVTRDRKMKRLAKEYAKYGFEIHKGYGTKQHYEAIERWGISPVHRKSFLGKIIK
jgi:ribonuclease HII